MTQGCHNSDGTHLNPRSWGGGRKKGGKNKDIYQVRAAFDRAVFVGWNPIEEMARMAHTGLMQLFDPLTQLPYDPPQFVPIENKIRARMYEEVASYSFPKLKSIEFQDSDNIHTRVGLTVEMVSGGCVQSQELSNNGPLKITKEIELTPAETWEIVGDDEKDEED